MEKSYAYRLAQVAILNSNISNADKLDVLRVLMADEDLAKFTEEKENTDEAIR